MAKNPNTCLFIGHHDASDNLYPVILEAIGELIAQGITEFWSGGYGHFDHMCERAVREWKTCGAAVKLVLALAYMPKSDEETQRYLSTFDETFLPDLSSCPARLAISRRNEWLARHAEHALVYVQHPFGGAAKTLSIAQHAGAIIHPICTKASPDPFRGGAA